jgi:hypothetical protein
MKAFLNVFREFNEIDLRNSRFGFNHDPVRFDTTDLGIFVFLAANRFEVVRERDRRETKDQNEAKRNPPRGIRHRGKD